MNTRFLFLLILFINIACCNAKFSNSKNVREMKYSEQDILNELDNAFKAIQNFNIKKIDERTNLYYFFMDLEFGYMYIANSQIHLFADESNWAIVFETNGYNKSDYNAQINMIYIGNCIIYQNEENKGRINLSNLFTIELISEQEFERNRNKMGSEMEQFELISPDADSIQIRDRKVKIEKDISKYKEKLISFRQYENPNNLIGFKDIVRYLSETESGLMSASEEEIREHIPKDIPKLMKIDAFYFKSIYEPENLPSSYETFQQITKILVTKDTTLWKPTMKPDNHWSNWNSGSL